MIIKNATAAPSEILGKQEYRTFHEYSKSPYIVEIGRGAEIIIENVLTGEIRIENRQSWNLPSDAEYKDYVENWYYIRNDLSGHTIVNMIKNFQKSARKNDQTINSYTIFTTLNCNAKCPYCYEASYSKMSMTTEVALKAAEFMVKNRGTKPIYIGWFGGEPLVNATVIDTITSFISDRDIPYYSTMISNGYLFNKYTEETIVNKWKLNTVQITLDGLSDTYDQVKGLGPGAFETVVSNIEYLNNLGIKVNIRMNLSNSNGDELLQLTEYLAERFKGRKNVFAYVHPLADDESNKATKETFNKMIEIAERLFDLGLAGDINLNHRPVTHCMADNDYHLCITPTGMFTPCEHYTESEFIGNLDAGVDYGECKESWKEEMPENDNCESCWRYPKCIRLKKCPGSSDCDHGMHEYWLFQERHALLNRYERYLSKGSEDKSLMNIKKKNVIEKALAERGKTLADRDYWNEVFPARKARGWCMAFIYAMFADAYTKDTADTLLYTTGRRWKPEAHYKLFKELNLIYDTPQKGDIAFYNINGWVDHAELVTAVSEDSARYDSVGGNIIAAGVPTVVNRKNISVNNKQLVGFGRPGYTA